ncbi:MAG: hemerythrin domain-containing protein [Cytophagaceae bacterium]
MITKETALIDLISQNRLLESVVERFNFKVKNYNLSIDQVCRDNGENPDFVVEILKAFDENSEFPSAELKKFSLESILSYLRKTHQYYLYKKLPEIEQSIRGLIKDYSSTHPKLVLLGSLFLEYKKELSEHIEEEESDLFPFIEYLIKLKQHGFIFSNVYQQLHKYSIKGFLHNHQDKEEGLEGIKDLIMSCSETRDTILPYRIFLLQLDIFAKDLERHARVEDEILVPKALALEKELKTIMSN